MADEENGSESFPGLNKRHGFFKAIERNQRDRDLYHQRTEERRIEARRKRYSDKKYPEKAIYLPPHLRNREETGSMSKRDLAPPPGVYKLEIEVAPKKWHKEMIAKVGFGRETANSLKRRYELSEVQRDAIHQMIEDFEQSLKL